MSNQNENNEQLDNQLNENTETIIVNVENDVSSENKSIKDIKKETKLEKKAAKKAKKEAKKQAKLEKKANKKRSVLKTILKIFLILLLVFVIVLGSAAFSAYYFINKKLDKIQYVDLKKEEITMNEGIDESLATYRNVALFGIDARADTFGPGNRSDCIMILSLNEKTKECKIMSIYRDTYLQIEGHGLDKVNHAYSFGTAKLALNTLNTNLDLNISEFVAINFDTVRVAVDQVGGITMDITSEEAKYINGYINGLNKQFGTNSANITKAGTYHLDGVQALAYSRIRYTSGGDYKRTARMRDVMIKAFEKAQKMSLSDLNKLADVILPHISTNINKNEIISSIPTITQFSAGKDFGWPYNTEGKMINGVWYGIPNDLAADVTAFHQELFPDVEYKQSDIVVEISNKIKAKVGK